MVIKQLVQADGQILSQAGFNQAMGITTTNPYPNSIFSQLFGPENVNYLVLGIDTSRYSKFSV